MSLRSILQLTAVATLVAASVCGSDQARSASPAAETASVPAGVDDAHLLGNIHQSMTDGRLLEPGFWTSASVGAAFGLRDVQEGVNDDPEHSHWFRAATVLPSGSRLVFAARVRPGAPGAVRLERVDVTISFSPPFGSLQSVRKVFGSGGSVTSEFPMHGSPKQTLHFDISSSSARGAAAFTLDANGMIWALNITEESSK